MNENDAPERLWIDKNDIESVTEDSQVDPDYVEYVRADRVAPDASTSERAERAATTIHDVFSDLLTKIPSDKTAHIEIMANIIAAEFAAIPDAIRQARRETWLDAAKVAEAMAAGEIYETGRQKAINIAAALRAEGEKGA